jgi:hypothetical protein
MKTRHDEMKEQFLQFHTDHPQVWYLFNKFTFELIERGFRHGGAKSVMERIRWETDQADVDGKSTFKCNNNHTSFYARAWVALNPMYSDFFRLRHQTSKDCHATNLPLFVPADFQYEKRTH